MANTYLTKTSISAGNRRTWTWSGWIKRSGLGEQRIFNHEQSSGTTNISVLKFDGNNKILYADNAAGSNAINLNSSNMVFEDVNAWYHIVLRVDTTDATNTNRARIYVNGQDIHSELGSFSTHTLPSQNYDTFANQSGNKMSIGAWANSTNQYFDGIMSHVHFADGQSYAPTVFGETDSTTGQWKIKTSPSVTYGTNGFFILKDGNSVTDQSGNSNNFTVSGGTLTNTESSPSNVFATMNPLFHHTSLITFSNGNNTAAEPTGNSTNWTTRWGISTIGFSSGKFYAEAKISDYGSGQLYPIGIVRDENIANISSSIGSDGWGYYALNSGGGAIIGSEDGTNIETSVGTSTTGDIIGLAVDADNNTLQFYKNGSALGSQVTGITAGTYFIGCNAYANFGVQFNFGNGYFGTTAVSSAGTNASGLGIFEYDVPTGFTALCTKGLNE